MTLVLSFLCATWFVIAWVQWARARWYQLLYKGAQEHIAATKQQIPESLTQPAQISTPVYTWDDSQCCCKDCQARLGLAN